VDVWIHGIQFLDLLGILEGLFVLLLLLEDLHAEPTGFHIERVEFQGFGEFLLGLFGLFLQGKIRREGYLQA
jgi:hypothetical protein